MYNIAVIFGGATPEHSISIITAMGAMKNLSLNYNPVPIYINTAGRWLTGKHLLDAAAYHNEPSGKECYFKPNCADLYVKNALTHSKIKIDCALLCLHGGGYEGGTVQGVLKLAGVPFTSPEVLPSAICMDKVVSKLLFKSLNIDTPKFVWGVANGSVGELAEKAVEKLKFPLIVKPARCGSSVGIKLAGNEEELNEAVEYAAQFDKKVIVEEALTDFRELNISLVRGKGEIKFSSVEEVESEHKFYTFDDKYTRKSTTKRSVPADISVKILGKILKISTAVYETLEMDGIVRFDFLVAGDKVYLNEVNTIPGSFAFYLWKNEGVSFAQLLNISIKAALAKSSDKSTAKVEYNREVLRDLDKIKAIVDK